MLPEDEHWPTSVASLPCISQHENRSIREWATPARRLLLKCFAPPFRDAEEDSLFRTEYLLLRRLRHPNLVMVRGFRTMDDGTLVIAMDAAPGTSLGSTPISPCWTPGKASIARQVLAGLDAVHRLGFVHADLKPDHVFIDSIESEPRVTLLDLGLATRQGETVVRGTPGWIPPEILNRAAWTVQSDLYLFGLILFQLTYGKPLPIGNDRESARRAHDGMTRPDEPVDHRLQRIIFRLIDGSPERRHSSARAVWEELREIRPTDAANMPDPTLCSRFHSFHGREQEIDEFATWLATLSQISDAVTATCRVRGELGIGKSALIEHLVARAETMGWTPCSPPSSSAHSLEPIHAVLRHPRQRVVVELRELSESAEMDLVWFQGGEHAGVHLRHEIDLEVISPLVAQRIAEDKLEQYGLVKRVAILSLGNPRLLVSFCEPIDWLTEFAWREFPDAVQDRPPEGGPPHVACLAWLQAQGRSLHPRSLESLTLASLLQWWTPPVIEEVIGRSWTTVVADLAPFYDRGLVTDYRGEPRLLSRSWEGAAIRASADARETIRLLLQRIGHISSVAKLTAMTDLAIALELWPEVRHLFDRAVRAMLDEGRQAEAMVFLYRTYNAIPEGMDVATPELWHRLSEAMCFCDGASWYARPDRLVEQIPRSVPSELRKVLSAWFLVDARRKADARKALGSLEDHPRGVPPSILWIATYLKCHLRSDLGHGIDAEMKARTLEWLDHPCFRSAADQFGLRYLYSMNFVDLVPPSERLENIERMETEPVNAHWMDVIFRLERAAAYFHLGRLSEAQHDAEFALSSLHSMTANPRLLRANQTSAAIAYELGDFPRAHQLGKRMARLCLLNDLLVNCAWQVRNLSLVDLARGQLGMALADYRTAEDLHWGGHLLADDARRTWLAPFLRWESGDCAVVSEIVEALGARPEILHNQRTLGLHELATGSVDSGRNRLRSAVDGFAAAGRYTEAADTLARWLEMEADLGHRAQAEELLLELGRCQVGLTPRIHAHVRVTEAHMLVLGWLEPSWNIEWLLLSLVDDIHRREFGLQLWRSTYYLARFYHEDGRFAEAAHYYGAARRSLRELIATLENDEQREGFRNRPGHRRFLAEAESRYPEA